MLIRVDRRRRSVPFDVAVSARRVLVYAWYIEIFARGLLGLAELCHCFNAHATIAILRSARSYDNCADAASINALRFQDSTVSCLASVRVHLIFMKGAPCTGTAHLAAASI